MVLLAWRTVCYALIGGNAVIWWHYTINNGSWLGWFNLGVAVALSVLCAVEWRRMFEQNLNCDSMEAAAKSLILEMGPQRCDRCGEWERVACRWRRMPRRDAEPLKTSTIEQVAGAFDVPMDMITGATLRMDDEILVRMFKCDMCHNEWAKVMDGEA